MVRAWESQCFLILLFLQALSDTTAVKMATAFDTPMLDYHTDTDVQMHPSAEPWFQDEANMDEETHFPLTRSSSDGDLVDVEVEMENY